jgi:pilus assembly protein FimV
MTSSKILITRCLPLAIAGLLHAPANQAATIGPLAVRTNNEQGFVAEAQLIPAIGENSENLAVRLAAPDKFDDHGIAWHYEFSRLRFQTQTQIDGSKLIRISSDADWPQNHLDLVLEINTPSGSQFSKLSTELIRPSAETYKPPRKSGFDPHSLSMDQSSYGPIRATDTLWSIAKNVAHQRGVSTQQMLEALQKNNPDAFKNSSIHSLKSGVTLKITQPEQTPEPKKKSEPIQKITSQNQPPSKQSKALELVAPVTADETSHADNAPNQTANPGSVAVVTASGEGDYLFLQTRVETLERQIGMMQQLLTLKDQQLDQLQGNVEQQLNQQTQLLALSILSSVLAAISMGLGLLLWRRKAQPAASSPVEHPAAPSIVTAPLEGLTDNATPTPTPVPVPVPETQTETETETESTPSSEPTPVPKPAAIKNHSDFESDSKDEFDFDFDLNPGIQRSDNNEHSSEDWTSEDNQESKIDLARAYFDMGDVDMAKELANQVLKAGNTAQQDLAKRLLEEIADPNH